MDFSNIITNIDRQIKNWLQEDIPSFDFGGFVVGSKQNVAYLYGKSEGILAGIPFFTKVFEFLNCEVEWYASEGDFILPSVEKEIAQVNGNINQILLGERLGLNIISRTSGIASKAYKIVSLAKTKGFTGKIAGTRKTTPGFRLFEKYALLIGGADTHRMDLSSMVMLKDNHIKTMGSITKAINKAKKVTSVWTNIEVETSSYDQAIEAINAGADIVMLDNFSPEDLHKTALKIKKKYPKIVLEASGGINESNFLEYISPDIDIISMGCLTQDYTSVDFSLKIQDV